MDFDIENGRFDSCANQAGEIFELLDLQLTLVGGGIGNCELG
jgi:hypothetical protein